MTQTGTRITTGVKRQRKMRLSNSKGRRVSIKTEGRQTNGPRLNSKHRYP